MPTTRRDFLAAGAGALAAPAAATRPNILFLMPDQWRGEALGFMGNPDVRTPHLDALARQGLVLPDTYANTPVCCPARAVILTGAYAHRNGMVANDLRLRESQPGLAKFLRDAGYRTGFVGKWHLDGGPRLPGFVPPGPRRHGFDFWAANECSHRHFETHYFRDTPDPIPLQGFEPRGWTDLGIEFLRGARNDPRPWFLTVQCGPPHDPYKAPPEYRRLYDPARLTMRPNWKPGPKGPGREGIAEYYAMCTAVDEQAGRILRALDDLALAGNTIVLFSSDHGDMLGCQGERLKRKPWDESIRVPCILRWPGRIAPGKRPGAIFTHVDFAPTLLGLCGIRPPASMQGADLSAFLTTGKGNTPDSAFLQIFGPYHGDGTYDAWRGIRTTRYTYARNIDHPWVLYDNLNDPYQLRNLARDPGAKPLRAEMERRLSRWMAETGDSWKRNWSELVEDNGRLYNHQAFYTVDEYLKWAKANPGLAQ